MGQHIVHIAVICPREVSDEDAEYACEMAYQALDNGTKPTQASWVVDRENRWLTDEAPPPENTVETQDDGSSAIDASWNRRLGPE